MGRCSRRRFTRDGAVDSPPVQHSLLKQPRGPRHKQAGIGAADPCCQMCYFSAKFDYFLNWLAGIFCIWQVADFYVIFAIFRRIFVLDLDKCLVQFIKMLWKYCGQIHFYLFVSVFCCTAACFSPVEILYFVRLQWSARPVTDQCSRRMLDCMDLPTMLE